MLMRRQKVSKECMLHFLLHGVTQPMTASMGRLRRDEGQGHPEHNSSCGLPKYTAVKKCRERLLMSQQSKRPDQSFVSALIGQLSMTFQCSALFTCEHRPNCVGPPCCIWASVACWFATSRGSTAALADSSGSANACGCQRHCPIDVRVLKRGRHFVNDVGDLFACFLSAVSSANPLQVLPPRRSGSCLLPTSTMAVSTALQYEELREHARTSAGIRAHPDTSIMLLRSNCRSGATQPAARMLCRSGVCKTSALPRQLVWHLNPPQPPISGSAHGTLVVNADGRSAYTAKGSQANASNLQPLSCERERERTSLSKSSVQRASFKSSRLFSSLSHARTHILPETFISQN